jgi:hypothetical protein
MFDECDKFWELLRKHEETNVDRNRSTKPSVMYVAPSLNFLKSTGYVMYHQFNIQQMYALPTLYLYVLYLSENKQRLVPLTA